MWAVVSKPLVFINWRNDAFVNYPNEKFSDQFYEIVELDGCWIVDLEQSLSCWFEHLEDDSLNVPN